MGSDITWENVGKDSFEVTLTVYRDCTGIDLSKPSLSVSCDSGGSISTSPTEVSNSYVDGKDITPICDNSNSECGSGGFGYGIEKFQVKYTVDLSNTNCCKVRFHYSECCRSNSITTGLSGDQYYAESWFNRCKAPQNSSPDFSQTPTDILCKGRKQVYTQGAVDTDTDSTGKLLDSLSYSFASPLGGPSNPLNYNNPYSKDIPLDYKGTKPSLPFVPRGYGFHLDNKTGDLRFTPTKVQTSVMSIKVTEWREINGNMVKIGETRRDVQFFVKNCPQNASPTITGMDCPQNNSIKTVCEGDLVKTSFCTSDPDQKDSVDITFSPGNLPGSPSFVVTNPKAQYQNGELTWTPGDGDASPIPYRFSVTAKDDHCPVAGRQTRTFQIEVNPTPKAEITVKNKGCGTYQFSARPLEGAGIKYLWVSSSSKLKSRRQTFNHTFEEPGEYPFKLDVTAQKCTRTYQDTVNVPPFLRVDLGNDTTICKGEGVTLGGMPKDTNGRVTYTWYDSVKGKRTRTFKNLTRDTTISVTIQDTVCSFTDRVKIDVRDNPNLDLGSDPRICADDTAVVAPQLVTSPDSTSNPPWIYLDGGQQKANYKWHRRTLSSPAFSKNDTVELTDSGRYILEASDTFNCASNDTLNLSTNPELKPQPFPPKICTDDTSLLRANNTGGPNVKYTWTNLETQKTYNSQNIQVSPDSTTQYALVVEETTKGVFCKDSATTTVEVEQLPEVEIDPMANICSNQGRLNLSDTLDPNRSFGGQWVSNDLPAASLGSNGSFNTKNVQQGQYSVRFKWKEPRGTPDPRCGNVDTAELMIRPAPNVSIGTDTILCTHNEALTLNGTPAAPPGDWSGDGVSNANEQSSLTYDPGSSQVPTGVNSIVYTYTEPVYQCTTPDTIQVTVQQSPTPDFKDQEICINNKTLPLTNIASKGTWLGDEVSNGNFNTPDAPGDYKARYKVSTRTFRKCTVEDTINVKVKDTVEVKAATASGKTAFCETRTDVPLEGTPTGAAGQWVDINNTAQIDNGNIFNPEASVEGKNKLAYKYKDPNTGCVNKDTITLSVDPKPKVSILKTDTSKCKGSRYKVVAKYDNTSRIPIWQALGRSDLAGFSNITSDDKTVSAFYTPNDKQEKAEEFVVTAEAQNDGACPNRFDSVSINIKPVPQPDFRSDNQGCPPFKVEFDNKTTISEGGQIASYQWQLGNGTQTNTKNPETVYQKPGNYNVSLKVTSEKNCQATISKENFIQVAEKPKVDFTADPILTTINAPEITFNNLTQSDNKPVRYQWSFGENDRGKANISTLENPSHTYADTGAFTVQLTAKNDVGCADTLTRENYVRVRPTVINYAPSAFSPNGDGTNDTYRVEARYFTSFNIQIFNRWGEKVYQSDNYEKHGWDGSYEGQKAPSGVYTYVVQATGMDGEDYTFSGTITLIR